MYIHFGYTCIDTVPAVTGRGRGATGSRGSIDPPLFQVRGPHMALDPSLFVVFTCAQYVAVA